MDNCGVMGFCPNPDINCEDCEYYFKPIFDDEDEEEDGENG